MYNQNAISIMELLMSSAEEVRLQHLGRADIIQDYVDPPVCECGKEMSEEEEDLGECFKCHNKREDTNPSPKEVYGS